MDVLDTENMIDSQLELASRELVHKMGDAVFKAGLPLLIFLAHLLDLFPLPEALTTYHVNFWIDVLAIAGVMVSSGVMALSLTLYGKAKLEVRAAIRERQGVTR